MSTVTPKLRITLTVLVFGAWLGTPGCSQLGAGGDSPTAPSSTFTPGSTINYTAIGASDVNGVGSSVQCFSFLLDCLDGTGYVFVAARTLRSQGFTVKVTSLGLPTAVISNRVQLLGLLYGQFVFGNFIDGEAALMPATNDLVTIFAGPNDVNVITTALGHDAGGSDPSGFIDQQVRLFGDDFATLLNAVRTKAPSARIVVLNVPNLAGLPSSVGDPLLQRQAAQRVSVGMTTTVINSLTSQNIRVVDLMCDQRLYQASIYSSDGFHPNDAGYAIMGDLVARAVTSSVSSPPSSCPPMTLVQ